MPENYDHYISKNIKAFYKRRLAAPIIYLIVLILAWHFFFAVRCIFSGHFARRHLIRDHFPGW